MNYRLHTNKQCKHTKGGVHVVMSKFNNPKNIIKSWGERKTAVSHVFAKIGFLQKWKVLRLIHILSNACGSALNTFKAI